jgi:hypothetical protein
MARKKLSLKSFNQKISFQIKRPIKFKLKLEDMKCREKIIFYILIFLYLVSKKK